jgi:hypothetical protein
VRQMGELAKSFTYSLTRWRLALSIFPSGPNKNRYSTGLQIMHSVFGSGNGSFRAC